MSGKVCPRCNNIDIKEGANFCHVCGLDLRKGAADETTANQIESIVPKPIDRKRLEKLISLNG